MTATPQHSTDSKANAHLPRYPQRANGRARFESLLDALEEMLQEVPLSEFNLVELGKRAGAQTASVYHFFPSKDAAIIALAERYYEDYLDLVEEAGKIEANTWQEVLENCGKSGLEYNAKNPLAMEIFFGSDVSWRIKQLDAEGQGKLASIICEACRRQFSIDGVKDLEEIFTVALTISDSIWALSYIRHGCVTDEYAEEAGRAVIAYLRLYLADFAPRQVRQ